MTLQRWSIGPLALTLLLSGAGCVAVPRPPADPLAASQAKLHEAERQNSSASIGLYLDAARQSLALATNSNVTAGMRASAASIYNRAIAGCMVELHAQKGRLYPGPATSFDIAFAPPPRTTRFLVADDIPRRHLKTEIRRPGFGGTLVGVSDGPGTASENRPLKGFVEPFTVGSDRRWGARR